MLSHKKWFWRNFFGSIFTFVSERPPTRKTNFWKEWKKWKAEWSFSEEERQRGGAASDYWEDKGAAVWALTAASTSGVPPLQDHHPIPSTRGNFLLPLFIYPPHSSPPPNNKMGIITLNNATTAGPPRLHFRREPPTSTYRLLDLFQSDLFSRSQRWKRDTSESCKECHWQVLVWSHLGEIPHSCRPKQRWRPHQCECFVLQTEPVLDYGRLTRHFETSCQLLEEQQTKLRKAGAGLRGQDRKDCT